MKAGATLETERLLLRHWTLTEEDRNAFHFLMSDETVRKFYPDRLTRPQADQRLEWLINAVSEKGMGWAVACLKSTGEPIGFTGLWPVTFNAHFTPTVEIGWIYRPTSWGKGYASEAAKALLQHGFDDLDLTKIVAFAVHNNQPSIDVMKRIGMKEVKNGTFNHPSVPDTHEHLKRHVLYEIEVSND